MSTKIYPVDCLPDRILLGRQTENGARQVHIDCQPWLAQWPDLNLSIWVTPPVGDAYPAANATLDGDILEWTISSTDTAYAGDGMMEVVGLLDGIKTLSAVTQTYVTASTTAVPGTTPEAYQGWVDQVLAAGAEAKDSAELAAASEQIASDAADEAEAAMETANNFAKAATKAEEEADASAETAANAAMSATASATQAAESASVADTHRLAAADEAGKAGISAAAAEASATAAATSEANAAASAEAAQAVLDSIPPDYQTTVDEAKTHAPAIVCEASGGVVTVTDAAARDAAAVVSTITAVQEGEGDPSPDNIRPITPVQAVSLTRTGTNLLDIANCPYGRGWTQSRVTLAKTNTGVIMTTNVDLTSYSGRMYLYIGRRAELVGQTITVTGDYASSVVDDSCIPNMALMTSNRMSGYLADDAEGFAQSPKSNTCTGVVPETGREYVYVVLYLGYSYTAPAGSTVEWSNIRVNIGSTDLGYEPYAGQTLTADLPDVYGGTLDWVSGVLTVTHRGLDLTTETWYASGARAGRYILNCPNNKFIVCSHYPYGRQAESNVVASNDAQIIFNTDFATLDDWLAFLTAQKEAGTPVQIFYGLLPENYTTVQLDPQTLTMLKGNNVLRSDTGGASVVYVADTKMYIDNAIAAIAASIINA